MEDRPSPPPDRHGRRGRRRSRPGTWRCRRAGGRTRLPGRSPTRVERSARRRRSSPPGRRRRSAIGTDSPVATVHDDERWRTVTVPMPATVAVPASRSRMRAVCSSTPRTKTSSGSWLLQERQPALAHVAVPGVVVAALGVVVVGHHRRPQAGLGQQVEALQPVGLLADLVHLVHRQGEGAQGDGGGAGEGDAAAGAELVGQHRRHLAALPLGQGVRRAPGPGEHVPGVPQAGQHQLVGHASSAASADRYDATAISRCTLSRK